MARQSVQDFKPSINGFHFPNSFDPGPVLTIPVPPFGDIPVGDAAGGLCGGMVFSVMDIFGQGLKPLASVDAPKPGTAAFEYLAKRLLDSFNGVEGVFKYLEWMRLPTDAEFFGILNSIAWHSVNDEWPNIKADLDDGRLCPLGVIKVESTNPFDLGKNHQVLAYGYDLDESSGNLVIRIYDPNCPDADDVTLSLNIADPNNPSHITMSSDANGRGFFLTNYDPATPDPALIAT